MIFVSGIMENDIFFHLKICQGAFNYCTMKDTRIKL